MNLDYRLFEEITLTDYRDYSICMDGDRDKHGPHVHLQKKHTRIASISIENGRTLTGEVPRGERQHCR